MVLELWTDLCGIMSVCGMINDCVESQMLVQKHVTCSDVFEMCVCGKMNQ